MHVDHLPPPSIMYSSAYTSPVSNKALVLLWNLTNQGSTAVLLSAFLAYQLPVLSILGDLKQAHLPTFEPLLKCCCLSTGLCHYSAYALVYLAPTLSILSPLPLPKLFPCKSTDFAFPTPCLSTGSGSRAQLQALWIHIRNTRLHRAGFLAVRTC